MVTQISSSFTVWQHKQQLMYDNILASRTHWQMHHRNDA